MATIGTIKIHVKSGDKEINIEFPYIDSIIKVNGEAKFRPIHTVKEVVNQLNNIKQET